MVGREVFLQTNKTKAKPKDIVLELQELWVHDARGLIAVKGVSFNVVKRNVELLSRGKWSN